MKISADDRRTAWLEVFKGSNMPGDLTVTWVEPGAILAWHRHEFQEDWMLVLSGSLKVGAWQGTIERVFAQTWETMTPKRPQPLVIPAGWWHGYENIGHEPCLLLTYVTQPYNKDDEFRMDPAIAPVTFERKAR